MSELKTCPFCGSKNLRYEQYNGLCYVQCRKCGAMTDDCKHAEDAVEMWNDGRVLDD